MTIKLKKICNYLNSRNLDFYTKMNEFIFIELGKTDLIIFEKDNKIVINNRYKNSVLKNTFKVDYAVQVVNTIYKVYNENYNNIKVV